MRGSKWCTVWDITAETRVWEYHHVDGDGNLITLRQRLDIEAEDITGYECNVHLEYFSVWDEVLAHLAEQGAAK